MSYEQVPITREKAIKNFQQEWDRIDANPNKESDGSVTENFNGAPLRLKSWAYRGDDDSRRLRERVEDISGIDPKPQYDYIHNVDTLDKIISEHTDYPPEE